MVGLWMIVARRDDGVATAACGCPRFVALAAARTRGRLGSHFAGLEAAAGCWALLAQAVFLLFLFETQCDSGHSFRGLGRLLRKYEGARLGAASSSRPFNRRRVSHLARAIRG